jgi:hypothetical protein
MDRRLTIHAGRVRLAVSRVIHSTDAAWLNPGATRMYTASLRQLGQENPDEPKSAQITGFHAVCCRDSCFPDRYLF